MPYLNAYFGEWESFTDTNEFSDGSSFSVWLYDTTSFTTEDIDVSGKELRLKRVEFSQINNDKNKFSPIRAFKVEIDFLSSNNADFTTFSSGTDRKWLCKIFVESQCIFHGFLIMDDIQGAFLPHPYTVTLTAIDDLGTLKDKTLTNKAGANLTGTSQLIEYVALCLYATGKELQINVACNIFPEGYSGASDDPWSVVWLDAKSFEKEIGVSEDCYTVLSKILKGYGCFVTQYNNEWWIIGEDELRHSSLTYYQYTSDGLFLSAVTTTTNITKLIGISENIKWRDASTLITIQRPKKLTKLFYNYETPKEIVCNQDFERGDFIADLGDETVDSETLSGKSYYIDCWDYRKNVPPTTQDSTAYIKRLFNSNDYEKERFIHFPFTATSAFYYLVCTDKIPMTVKDKFSIGVDFRWDNTPATPYTIDVIWIRLYGDDGSFWNLRVDTGSGATLDPEWAASNSTWSINQRFLRYVSSDPLEEWVSFSIESLALPVSGQIEVCLMNTASSNTIAKDYSNLTFEYIPFINGSYRKYTSESHSFTQDSDDYSAKVEEQVHIWDGIKPLFKGALKIFNGTGFDLAQSFYHYLDGSANGFQYDRLAKYICNQYWNQYRFETRVFEGRLQGLESSGTNLPGLIQKYRLEDVAYESTNRYFEVISLPRMNLRDCTWEATLLEVYSLEHGYEYDELKWEFKYT